MADKLIYQMYNIAPDYIEFPYIVRNEQGEVVTTGAIRANAYELDNFTDSDIINRIKNQKTVKPVEEYVNLHPNTEMDF